MKRILIAAAVLLMAVTARADVINLPEVLDKVEWKQGIAYSIEDAKFNYLSTLELLEWNSITLEAGYAGAADNTGHKIVGVVSYPLVDLSNYVTIPLLELIDANLGMYAGYGRVSMVNDTDNDNEFDWGISLTLLKIKF